MTDFVQKIDPFPGEHPRPETEQGQDPGQDPGQEPEPGSEPEDNRPRTSGTLMNVSNDNACPPKEHQNALNNHSPHSRDFSRELGESL